jgi:molybdopterin-containing oxidoreductase family iron-sulfur binding subunit
MRYGMVIDLRKCAGCYSCMAACKMENFTPRGVFFTRVLVDEIGKYPNARMRFVPVLCNHCENPACVSVCPTGATSQRKDGVVTIDPKKCMGCRYCIVACPYRVRFFIDKRGTYYDTPTTYEVFGFQARDYQEGTVIKCDFCAHRLEKGLEPACVVTCPSRARYFGDLDNTDSEVSKLIAANGGHQLLADKGTNPSVYYIR